MIAHNQMNLLKIQSIALCFYRHLLSMLLPFARRFTWPDGLSGDCRARMGNRAGVRVESGLEARNGRPSRSAVSSRRLSADTLSAHRATLTTSMALTPTLASDTLSFRVDRLP